MRLRPKQLPLKQLGVKCYTMFEICLYLYYFCYFFSVFQIFIHLCCCKKHVLLFIVVLCWRISQVYNSEEQTQLFVSSQWISHLISHFNDYFKSMCRPIASQNAFWDYPTEVCKWLQSWSWNKRKQSLWGFKMVKPASGDQACLFCCRMSFCGVGYLSFGLAFYCVSVVQFVTCVFKVF